MINRKAQILLPFFLFFILLTIYVSNHFFYWDTIKLVAAPAHFFYGNNFSTLITPEDIDAGHFPLLAMYIAKVWQLFGKSLVVAHFAMLPFLLGIVYQVYVLAKYFLGATTWMIWAMVLVLADPTFLSQATMVSPDIVLVFCFFMAVNAILNNKKTWLFIAVLILFLISMRGLIAAFIILWIDLIYTLRKQYFRGFPLHMLLMKAAFYVVPLLVFLSYQIYHYNQTGWVWSSPDSDWAEGRTTNDFKGAFYNIGIFGWRILDFGRALPMVILIVMLFKFRRKLFSEQYSSKMIVLFFTTGIMSLIPFLYFEYLTNHRYILPLIMLLLLIFVFYTTKAISSSRIKTGIFSISLISLLLGNFWVYPEKIAQGWEASLAHLPFYNLQLEMNNYLDEHEIPYHEVGTTFPILGKHDVIFLDGDNRAFQSKNVGKDKYVLYSNSMNDFSDKEIELLHADYQVVKTLNSPTVYIQLFERK